MKTKHTPGEWKVIIENNFPIEIHAKAIYNSELDSMMDGDQVCIISEEYNEIEVPFEEQQANAKLIAAAPEMLDVLLELCENNIHLKVQGATFKRIKMAIKKATE